MISFISVHHCVGLKDCVISDTVRAVSRFHRRPFRPRHVAFTSTACQGSAGGNTRTVPVVHEENELQAQTGVTASGHVYGRSVGPVIVHVCTSARPLPGALALVMCECSSGSQTVFNVLWGREAPSTHSTSTIFGSCTN